MAALFDVDIHSPPSHIAAPEMCTTEIWNSITQRVISTSCGHDPKDWGVDQARFVYMFRHNDAGYFSYTLSTAYAADVLAETFARNLDPEAGWTWRCQILEAGGGRPEMDILEDLLDASQVSKGKLMSVQKA